MHGDLACSRGVVWHWKLLCVSLVSRLHFAGGCKKKMQSGNETTLCVCIWDLSFNEASISQFSHLTSHNWLAGIRVASIVVVYHAQCNPGHRLPRSTHGLNFKNFPGGACPQTSLQQCTTHAQSTVHYARCTKPHSICMSPHSPLLQSLDLPLKRRGIKINEYFYSQKKMKLLAEQHAEHSEIETEKQSGRRSAYVMKLSNTSYTTNTLKVP